jgi:hypothetical protein
MQSRTLLIWIGVALIFGGLLFTAAKANWRGRFRGETRSFTTGGFGLASNWPGLAMIGLGTVLAIGSSIF